MKKFMTVLLVVAVLFTFSFSSAFAAKPYEAEAAKGDQLYETTDVTGANGEYGITGAEKAAVIDTIEGYYAGLTPTNNYYAKEKAAAKELIAQAVKDAEAATTAKELAAVKTDLDKALKVLTDGIVAAKNAVKASTAKIDLSRVYARYKGTSGFAGTFVLEGYGKFVASDYPATAYIVTSGGKQELKDIFGAFPFVTRYLLDNGYVKSYQIADGIAAMISELKPVNNAYTDAAAKEKNAIQDKVWAYADKYSATVRDNRLTVADIDGMYAVSVEMDDYAAKYNAALGAVTFDTTTFTTAYNAMVVKYFDAFDAETVKIPAVAKLTDADKATVIALYDKINAYYDEFATNHEATTACAVPGLDKVLVADYDYVANAYNHFLSADKTAYGKLDAFTEIKVNGTKASFDDSEKNVKAMEATRKAYDEFVANYGYGSLKATTAAEIAEEAKIVVGEHNYKLAAGYDEKEEKLESSLVQAYLNNATVKVTTKALGNKKVRVQSTIDTESFRNILAAMANGCTVEYQFYYKKAAADTYKAGKVKDVNYTTFKLVKGTKYNFQCQVVIKDADGKVVATKDYKASTVGTRTVK